MASIGTKIRVGTPLLAVQKTKKPVTNVPTHFIAAKSEPIIEAMTVVGETHPRFPPRFSKSKETAA